MRQLQLIGSMLTHGDDLGLDAMGALFGRLGSEVRYLGDLTRHIGFASESGEVRFFGVQVERIGDIPQGMVAWEIREDMLNVLSRSHGTTHREAVSWQWYDAPESGMPVGEFTVLGPTEWTPANLAFRMTANAYWAPGKLGHHDNVVLTDYDPAWPERYREYERWIRELLPPEVVLRVEHYGSTAIPGMPAKPIIDILVEVPSFDKARQDALPWLNRLDTEYWWYSGHMTFVRRRKFMAERVCHIHMAPAGHDVWKGIPFRDHLRTHPQDAARYTRLKQDLAAAHAEDRERYTQAKTELVHEITSRAGK